MNRLATRVGKLEAQYAVTPNDCFEGVTGRDLIKLLTGQRDIDQAPARVERAVTWLGILALAATLHRADRVDATQEDIVEGAQARAEWQLPSEGAIDYLALGQREQLTPALLERLRWELAKPAYDPTWVDDPDAPSGTATGPVEEQPQNVDEPA
jgi:hypothetical protein